MGKFGLKNLFGKSKDFFDKEATIKEYFAIVPPENRRKCDTYDELYEEALKYVSKQDFEINTANQEDYFYEIKPEEGVLAVLIGVFSFFVGMEIDKHGKDIEGAIDKVLSPGYDTHNPFDVKAGKGHRVFGHDVFTFGLKNVPGDALIKVNGVATTIGEYLGVGPNTKVRMWDLIWKFYGENKSPLKGIFNSLSHTIVHFAKDLFTPDGLPLPFTSLFDRFLYKPTGININGTEAKTIFYKDSLMKLQHKLGLELKASDLASLALIESIIGVYISTKKTKMGDKAKELLKDMKLLSMGTCLSMQMATILTLGQLKTTGSANVPGGKANALMMGAFMKLTIQEMLDIVKTRKNVNKEYKSDYMRGYYNGKRQ